ncbi:tubulin-folding cofactor B [Lentinula raphanica]|uniref:Tubulin-folding cofactor B n=1 Tax=Lentinula raphanica TaxID=153919 RepID=A0AA38P379_9AGAR|nr:tubulin-folding cofactor B [Lentinula raphanica]KAJ3768566.1 tubulin-folding cofactor B [Lentinula raphanica]KAJ3822708.1 tubulin-folding cofactor B [Lentinula raphanica]KAJ3835296.1 tubulin-folding cofactor B [Lentinula raphanica]KAJ3968884.1 tubulin-folding cofactor B [Lentinula raphanica]
MSTLHVFVVSPDTRSERRFDPHITVGQLKSKLELFTGIPAASQVISVLNSEDNPTIVAQLSDDSKPLGFYSLQDWQVLKVDDSNPSASFTGQLTDVSQVDKFELSDDAYAQRTDSVLAYKQQHKVGRFAPKAEETKTASIPANMTVNARCEVESLEPGLSKRGTIRFVGETKFASGVWVGVEYDEPFGKNDGSVKGDRYFTCRPNYGVFIKPEKVKVGDFPELALDLDEEM